MLSLDDTAAGRVVSESNELNYNMIWEEIIDKNGISSVVGDGEINIKLITTR